MRDKKKIVQILFALTIIILIANIIAGKGEIIKTEPEEPREMALETADSYFSRSLYNFGLKEEWIKKKDKVKNGDTSYTYNIKVPRDLPIPVLLEEVFANMNQPGIEIDAQEEKIHGASAVSISSAGILKILAKIEYDAGITREAGEAGFIVNNIDQLREEELLTMLTVPEPYGVLLLPSKQNVKLAERIKENGKEYAVLLSSDITELEYKLNSSYSEKRLVNSVRSMLGHFAKASFFVVDDNSGLYSSDIYPFIENEFLKRKIALFKLSSFIQLESGMDESAADAFGRIMQGIAPGEKEVIIMPSDDFLELPAEAAKYRKKGVRFLNPSVLLKD